MATEPDVVALFERANPVPEPDAIDVVVSADERLAIVLHEEHSNVTLIEPTTTRTPASDRRRWLIPAAAAAILVIVLVTGLAIFGADETVPSDSIPSTIAPPPTTTIPAAPDEAAAAALAVIDTFFAAYNAGDTDAVMAQTAPNVVVTETFDAGIPSPGGDPYEAWDQRLTWNHAQDEILTDHDCRMAVDQTTEGVTLACDYSTLDALVQAVDGTPIPTTTRFTIVDGTITEIHQGYGRPDFSTLGVPFARWMEKHQPEVSGALLGGWTTHGEAVEHGRLRAVWAQEWARSRAAPDGTMVVEGVAMAPPLPAPADGETQQTIVGDITWTLLEGDGSTQPEFVLFELLGEFYGSDGDARSWRSSDSIEWTTIEPPLDSVFGVIEAQGETWAVRVEQRDPDEATQPELVRWNGSAFEPVELPPTTAPTIEGLRRSGGWMSLSQTGGRLVVLVNETYNVPWNDFFGPGDWVPEMRSDGTIKLQNLRDRKSKQLEATVDETNPGKITIAEAGRTLTAVGPWPGIDAEDLIDSLGAGGVPHHALLIGGVDGFAAIPSLPPGATVTQVAELGDHLLALTGETDSMARELWASRDGALWERRDLPTPNGAIVDFVSISAGNASALLTIVSSQPGQVAETWHTNDGESWQVANGGASFGSVQQADFGWMSDNVFEERPSIAVSPDGIFWQEISIDLQSPEGAGGGSATAIGDTIILSQFEDFGDRTMWVGKVEPG